MPGPVRSLIVSALFLVITLPAVSQQPIPLLDLFGNIPANMDLAVSDRYDYLRPETLSLSDKTNGKIFIWKPGIEILTDIDSVRIYLNGDRSGTIPWEGDDLNPGIYRFSLEKTGYKTEDFMLLLEPDTRVTLFVRMDPTESPIDENGVEATEDRPDESEQIIHDKADYVNTSFLGFTGLVFCPLIPREKFPSFSAAVSIRTRIHTGQDIWAVPVDFSTGTGRLENWFFSFSGRISFSPRTDENHLGLDLSSGYRLTAVSSFFQAGLTARISLDTLLDGTGMVPLDDPDSSPSGLALSVPLGLYAGPFAFFSAPELILSPVSVGGTAGILFEGFSFQALIRGGVEVHYQRLYAALSGALKVSRWEFVEEDSLEGYGALELRIQLPGELFSLGFDGAFAWKDSRFCLTPGLTLASQF
jgi:hypothetical protein